MSHLRVPYFRQKTRLSCGLACLRMALAYYGDKVSEKELRNLVKIHNYGILAGDIGAVAQKRGYKVTVFTLHLRLFGPLSLPFGSKITKKTLKSIKVATGDKEVYRSLLRFVESGGTLNWDVPKIAMIEGWLTKKVPCLISVNTAAMNHFWRNWDNGHQLLVNAVDRNNVFVLDPDPLDKNAYPISRDIFLPAWAINTRLSSGYLMVIEK